MSSNQVPHLFSPQTLAEALEILNDDYRRVPCAGGTDLMVARHFNRGTPSVDFINLQKIRALREISVSKSGVNIGSGVSFAALRCHDTIRKQFPLLWFAAGEVGSVAIQNRATIGGNIANASPAGDSLPTLLVYDAKITLVSVQGERRVAYQDFHLGYKKTERRRDELITNIFLPFVTSTHQYFRKVGARRAQAISKVGIAALAQIEKGVVVDFRLAFSSMAPVPLRCLKIEQQIKGKRLSAELGNQLRVRLDMELSAIDDIRSTKIYREQVAGNLVDDFFISTLATQI